jgi:hypothetical protein
MWLWRLRYQAYQMRVRFFEQAWQRHTRISSCTKTTLVEEVSPMARSLYQHTISKLTWISELCSMFTYCLSYSSRRNNKEDLKYTRGTCNNTNLTLTTTVITPAVQHNHCLSRTQALPCTCTNSMVKLSLDTKP